jgi:uncharacterized protein
MTTTGIPEAPTSAPATPTSRPLKEAATYVGLVTVLIVGFALAVGFIHGMFHVPLMMLTTTYNNVGNRWIVVPTVVVTLTAAGVFYAWLKDRSGSVWPVAVAHGTVNVLIDGAAYAAILSPVAFAYTATESGFVTMVTAMVLGAVLLVRGRTWGR